MHFVFFPLRFEFLARESLYFPPGKAANILRGALGVIFRGIACVPECEDAKTCRIRDSCPYARIFEPSAQGNAHGEGPSGLADWPRPFVFRARHLDGRTVNPGGTFYFDLHVFSLQSDVISYFILTFAALAREGIGPRRGKAELQRVSLPGQTVYEHSAERIASGLEPMKVDLTPTPDAPNRIRVDFLSATELKHEHGIAARPEFPVLFGRIRDRVATLSRLYGAGALDIDYQGTHTRAAAIQMISCRLHRETSERRSTRTGQSHPLGGFLGTAEYEGDLAEFIPYLQAAKYTGVGRQAVWGKGEIQVECLRPS